MMEIADNCIASIDKQLRIINNEIGQLDGGGCRQTQSLLDSVFTEKDKNLDIILDQQTHIKLLIERDERIKTLRRLINEDTRVIEELRRTCSKISLEMLKYRQDLREEHSKELERFQLQQLKSIAEDQHRHQRILEQRQQELSGLKTECEREEKGRDSFLANVEKIYEKQIQQRQQALTQGTQSLYNDDGELRDRDYIELATVDEYAPYGPATNSKSSRASNTRAQPARASGTSRGRSGRGRSGRGRRG